MESNVVPFQGLFIVRQDTVELLKPVGEKYITEPCRLDSVLQKVYFTPGRVIWFGRRKVAQRSMGWIRKQRLSKRVSLVVCYKLSSELSQSSFRDVSSRKWQQQELCLSTKEAGAKIQDVGSRVQTFSLRRGEKTEIGAIWPPNSPGTPGPGHSRTGTAPGNRTEVWFSTRD